MMKTLAIKFLVAFPLIMAAFHFALHLFGVPHPEWMALVP